MQLHGHDTVRFLPEVVHPNDTGERLSLVRELQLLTGLPAFHVIEGVEDRERGIVRVTIAQPAQSPVCRDELERREVGEVVGDRKSTRLNSSHSQISYAV